MIDIELQSRPIHAIRELDMLSAAPSMIVRAFVILLVPVVAGVACTHRDSAPSSAPAQSAVSPAASETTDMTPFWISLGAAVVLGGTAAVLGGLTHNASHDLDAELDRSPADRANVESRRHTVKSMTALTDGFSVATFVASSAAVYFLLWPPAESEVGSAADTRTHVSPASQRLAVSGTF